MCIENKGIKDNKKLKQIEKSEFYITLAREQFEREKLRKAILQSGYTVAPIRDTIKEE